MKQMQVKRIGLAMAFGHSVFSLRSLQFQTHTETLVRHTGCCMSRDVRCVPSFIFTMG